MKRMIRTLFFSVVWTFGMWGTSYALDIPYGGDALLHQTRGSAHVVVAKYVGSEGGQWNFATQEVFKGFTPRAFAVKALTSLEETLKWDVGETYVLFLQTQQRTGAFALAMGLYSVQKTQVEELAAYRVALSGYMQRDVSRDVLLRQVSSPVGYVQYSAAVDMARLNLWNANDVPWMGSLLVQNGVQDVRAKVVLVQQLGRLGSVELAGRYLESVASNMRNPVSVRVAAVESLSSLGAVQVLQRIAPSVDATDSLKLKRVYSESLNAQ
jgi:hypothetical protein